MDRAALREELEVWEMRLGSDPPRVTKGEREALVGLLRRAAAALAVPDPAGAWHPIASAPEGEFVLVAWSRHPGWRPKVLQRERNWIDEERAVYRPPSHWMPLPAPPEDRP